jgi:hypothetical protein
MTQHSTEDWITDDFLTIGVHAYNVQSFKQYYIPSTIYEDSGFNQNNFFNNLHFGGYAKLRKKYLFTSMSDAYFQQYIGTQSPVYSYSKAVEFYRHHKNYGFKILKRNPAYETNPIIHFNFKPFSKQNIVRKEGSTHTFEFKENSVTVTISALEDHFVHISGETKVDFDLNYFK